MSFDPGDMPTRRDAAAEVQSLRADALAGRGVESVALDAIAGRVLAEPVTADRDLPPHDYATMDGYAFDATDAYPLDLVDREVYPEDEPPALGDGEAVGIATGAPLPDGANAVLRREDADVVEGTLSGLEIAPGTYTYARASNVAAGETLFEVGERLAPRDAILLRDVGIESVDVREPFTAAVLATGSEIHDGVSQDLDSPMLQGLVESWGGEASYEGAVPDDRDEVEARIDELARGADVVVTTGGTSVGRKDYVIRALDALGDVRFHGVRMRPGKPVAAAVLPGHDAVAFAIPGKPIGAHTAASLVMRPFFTGDASLPSVGARLARSVDVPRPGFEYAVPVTLGDGDAMPLGHVDSPLQVYEDTFNSSVLSSSTRASRADGFYLTEEGDEAGDEVAVVPYAALE